MERGGIFILRRNTVVRRLNWFLMGGRATDLESYVYAQLLEELNEQSEPKLFTRKQYSIMLKPKFLLENKKITFLFKWTNTWVDKCSAVFLVSKSNYFYCTCYWMEIKYILTKNSSFFAEIKNFLNFYCDVTKYFGRLTNRLNYVSHRFNLK